MLTFTAYNCFAMQYKLTIVLVAFIMLGFNFQAKKKIVFFGDSITFAGAKPGGYIVKTDSLFKANGYNGAELIGAGISGNKVYDLYLRMEDDVLSKNPDAVVIWIGVNDVWHKRTYGTGTDVDRFEKFYTAMIKKLQSKNIQVFVCTPAVIGERNDYSNQLDGDLNFYSTLIRKIANTNNCTLIDLRKAFTDYELSNNPSNTDKGILTTDGVHLNQAGNLFVAKHMYQQLSKSLQ